mgnify:CR=1 FL=1
MLDKNDLKILVVDEFSATRTLVINQLRKIGYTNTIEAEDSFSALARLKSAFFDLVVIDWSVFDICGLDLLRQIREDSELKQIPILMTISEDLKGDIITAIKAGLNDFIVKPFEENEFKQKLEKIFA